MTPPTALTPEEQTSLGSLRRKDYIAIIRSLDARMTETEHNRDAASLLQLQFMQERDAALARVRELREALERLIVHHNTEDCDWPGGIAGECEITAIAKTALAEPLE